ncbi:MAG: VWA domain-containing protein [Boseongicola sp. SB0664_bin_43]|uniref:VWA domain-containing protein n=1 Tax=Boseongicola sp. SB0664_bin_43 TaxID=2604844 RepID=A0A6B0XXD7_9RHOB|nr:VWA domain-containing protein [Boseongicola sp. SB0664_bin_43]
MNDDDLDRLKEAMRAATPVPDDANKAANLALARKNFERSQGSTNALRQTPDCPETGLARVPRMMLNLLSNRVALAASTAIVAFGAVILLPTGDAPDQPTISAGRETVVHRPALDRLAEAGATVEAPPSAGRASAERHLRAQSRTTALRDGEVLGDAMGEIGFESHIVVPSGPWVEGSAEDFAIASDKPDKAVAESPVSTFSIDVDTASYSVVRSSLLSGYLPPAEAVRVEEMINYFPYAHPAPDRDAPFRPTVSVGPTPWNADTKLVQIAIQGALPEIDDRPPLNLVLLIDTSGSMDQANKLPLLKQSVRLLLGQLRPEDEVAIVTYAGSAGQALDPTPATERSTIHAALDLLEAGGSTAGQAGLQQAYATASGMTEDGEVTRVILATDGDFNVGLSDPEKLKEFVERQAESGAYLSVLGFGRGNLDDATMQALAQDGNGTAAYIDTLGEARKVLVDQLSGALFPIADDVKIQVEFNPAQISEYRLIGYETRALRREDFNNDAVDAGEIGAGHSVTAIYEVTPVGSPARLTDPLRYQADEIASTSDELGFLRLRYKAPGTTTSRLIEQPINSDLAPSAEAGFAAAIAGFGQLLRGSDYLGDWSWADAIALANANRGDDLYGYRAEAVQLMRLAQGLDHQR